MSETIRAALQRSSAALADEHAARRLLADCLEKTWGWVSLHFDQLLQAEQSARLDAWLKRAASGEPLAYISGRVGFWTLELRVTPDVLIPRPATETLVDVALAMLTAESASVLDLGTGSGALALALAAERPGWAITATDNSAAALDVAKRNAADNVLTTVQFAQGSWFNAVPNQSFDGIVCNPPYIDPDDTAVEASVRRYEPHVALFSTDNGLADLQHVVSDAPARLNPTGWLAVEHGYQQAEPARALFAAAGFDAIETHDDLEGHPRVTSGRLPQ